METLGNELPRVFPSARVFAWFLPRARERRWRRFFEAARVARKAGVTYRVTTDQVGSVRLVVNTTTGAVAQRIDYDAFGRITQDTSPGFQPFAFATTSSWVSRRRSVSIRLRASLTACPRSAPSTASSS